MISRLTAVLLTLGLLSLVTARPVSHEESKKQDTSIKDLFTDKEMDDLFKRLFPSSNAEGQEFGVSKGSFTYYPDGRTITWGTEQGRRIPFSKGETQGTAQNANWEQDSIKTLPKDLFEPSKTAKKQGISITLPDGNSFEFGKEQGRRVGWSHEQGRRVGWSHGQGRRVGWSHEQGRKVGWSHEQGRRVPFGEKQGIRVGWGKDQGLGRRVALGEQQGAKPVYSVKEQSSLNPWLGYQYEK